jgi:hypothetical protein
MGNDRCVHQRTDKGTIMLDLVVFINIFQVKGVLAVIFVHEAGYVFR